MMMKQQNRCLRRSVLLGLWALTVSACYAETPSAEDWTEAASRWYAQSYWQDPSILQKHAFTTNTDDKVAGQSSVQAHIRVAANRPKDGLELRLVPPKPLNLSKAEAFEVSLKTLDGTALRPREVFLCSLGFKKLAVVKWPRKLTLSAGGEWQRAVIDLTAARIIDKAKPGPDAEYDRSDVATICLNFTLPKGEVDTKLLIDAMRTVALPPPPVKRERRPDGAYVLTTAHYSAVVGANGYLQSLRAGATEFLAAAGPSSSEGGTASAFFADNSPSKGIVLLGSPAPRGRTALAAKGEKASIEYAFRERDFDITVQQKIARAGLLHFLLSPEVVAALDGRTDRALQAARRESGPQINTRLVTSTGAVLCCGQSTVGYARMSTGVLSGNRWAFRLMAMGSARQTFTLRPIAEPTAAEAVGFHVEAADPDFLLPGGKPIRFDIRATSYSKAPVKGEITFQVCDYLTRKPVGQRVTPFELKPGQTLAVPTDVPLSEPGPYRGKVIVADGSGKQRDIGWVFTYDFPNYKPTLTRQPDFHAFWQETLAELARVPMDAKLTPVPDQSTRTAEAYKVSLATLGGRRVHCWYWKPHKPGRYPVRFEVPSSGVYPRTANQVPRGGNYCGMWMAIHGLPVDFDPKNPPKDPAAWGYWTHGIASPKTSMWRTIYASLVRGVDFLCSREEVDAKRIMVAGGSQGGGLSMVLAGLDRRIAFAAPAHSGLARLDWTVLHEPGFWPFRMNAKPAGQTTEQFLKTLSYFDAANFTPDITCPVVAEVSLLDTVTASGNQICALAHVKPGLLELICDPWRSHASSPRGAKLRSAAVNRWLRGDPPVRNPIKTAP